MNENDMASAYQRGIHQASAGPCPSDEIMVALAEGRLSQTDRLEPLNHVMSCPACREAFDLLRVVPVAARQLRSRQRARWMRPAVALAVAASAVFLIVPRLVDDEPVMRGGETLVEVVQPLTSVASGSVSFVWRPVASTVRYELRILDQAGQLVMSETTRDTIYVADGAWTRSAAGYQWLVRATNLDGSISTSRPVSFEVLPQ